MGQRFSALCVVSLLTQFEPAVASEQPRICGAILLQRTTLSQSASRHQKAAFLKLVTSSNYQDARHNGNAIVPGYFDGSYSDFERKRAEFFSRELAISESDEASALLRIDLPPNASEAWVQCLKLHGHGLFAFISNSDISGATLTVMWKPPTGLGGQPLIDVHAVGPENVDDASRNELRAVTTLLDGEKGFGLKPAKSRESMRGSINGQVGSGVYSTNFYVPPLLRTRLICELFGHPPDQGITEITKGQHCADRALQYSPEPASITRRASNA